MLAIFYLPFFARGLSQVILHPKQFAMLSKPSIDSPPLPWMNRDMVAMSMPLSRAICPMLLSLVWIADRNWSVSLSGFFAIDPILPIS
jgi:hypothetical protein